MDSRDHRRVDAQVHPAFRSNPYENPRQIMISLCLVGALLILPALRKEPNDDDTNNKHDFRFAALAVFLSFLTLSYLQTRDLILSWPNPGFWRLVYGACAFYALFLVALLQMEKDTARSVLAVLFPDIGDLEDFETGLYARIDAIMGTCEISKMALIRQLFHCPWVLAHSVGWASKMLVFRDYYMAFFAAFVFELTEVTLMHAVPEFEECWWDSIFLDTLGANLLGMFIGHNVNKWIKKTHGESDCGSQELDLGYELDWLGRYTTLRPEMTQNNWLVFHSIWRLLQVVGIAIFMSLSDLNSFLLINSFGIANNASWFVLLRLLVVTMIWIPAGAEFYSFINKSGPVRLGPSIWILSCTTFAELAVSIKFFPSHMSVELEKAGNIGIPSHVLIPHLLSTVIFIVWALMKYNILGGNEKQNTNDAKESISCGIIKRKKEYNFQWEDVLLGVASIPMAYVFILGWKYD